MAHADPITTENLALRVGALKARALTILDAVVQVVAARAESVSAEYAALAGVPKSVLYHYFSDKVEMVLMAAQRYYAAALEPSSKFRTAFELSLWVAMRDDERLRDVVRRFHFDDRARLITLLGREDAATLFQALRYGAIVHEIPESQVLELQEMLLDLLRDKGQP